MSGVSSKRLRSTERGYGMGAERRRRPARPGGLGDKQPCFGSPFSRPHAPAERFLIYIDS